MKKLIPAICMTLVAAAMFATSTFAWFSMNTQVQATGMNVKATASKNLLISATENGTYATSAASSYATVTTLLPTSTADGASWFKTSNSDHIGYNDGVAGNGTIFAAATVTDLAAGGEVPTICEVVKHTFYVKVAGATGSKFDKLYVENISVTLKDNTNAPTDALSKALRIAVSNGTQTFIYNPLSGTATYKGVIAAGTVGTDTVFSTNNVTISTVNTPADTFGEVTTTATPIYVYVWYEGQDENCTTGNTANISELSVSVQFKADDNATA